MKILPTTLLCGALALTAAAPASAAKQYYEGETAGGYALSFYANGKKLSKLKTTVPTSCVSTKSSVPRAGGELFEPPGSFVFGKERKTKALQDPAMHYSEVTKNYDVTVKRSKSGRISGKLDVNFSFQTIYYDAFSNMSLETWICRGNDTF